MFNRSTKLRLRRVFRRRQRQVETVAGAAEERFERDLIGRFENLLAVKRFVISWTLLALVLIVGTVLELFALSGYYQTLRPVPGGVYTEGLVGTYSNANPIYATTVVDTAVSHLIFAGLFKYDDQNQLVGDLASGYTVDQTGKHYTVKLRPHLVWQDGRALTAADVAFTFRLIQNADATSPFLSSWQGVVVAAVNGLTVTFDLPSSLSAFPYSLTMGIVPEHILAGIPANQLRSSNFNTTNPVGAGPFAWKGIQLSSADPDKAVTLIGLNPSANYHGGRPKLDSYIIKAYGDENRLVRAFEHRDINAMAGLNEVPKQLRNSKGIHVYNFSLSAANMVFFKTTEGVLAEAPVRQALIKASDTQKIIDGLSYAARPVHEPLLLGQVGYNAAFQQPGYDPQAAANQLTAAGWVVGKDGVRSKAGRELTFRLFAQDTSENKYVLDILADQWRKVGVKVDTVLQSNADFQTTLEFHTYEALLYGISIGADPDVFAYWDSSQVDVRSTHRLNFSEYKSKSADTSLEAGRTRSDPGLRAIKYKPFLQAWQNDAPALGLYQPRFLYITSVQVHGLNEHTLNIGNDRYNSVASWQIRTARVTN